MGPGGTRHALASTDLSDRHSSGRPLRLIRRFGPYLLALGVIGALLLFASPERFAQATRRFNPTVAPLLALLSFCYYLLQGVRWRPLLAAAGVKIPFPRAILLNFAGQAVGLLPGGELARCVLVSEVCQSEVGDAVATVTVQELIYSLLITAVAVPGSLRWPEAAAGVLLSLVGIATVFLVLTVPAVFRAVTRVLGRIPVARRYTGDVEELRRSTVLLLTRWDTLAWSLVSVAQVLITVTMFWLAVQAVAPGMLSYPQAALVYAIAHLAGSLSFSPGGLGGFEAVCVGMLLAFGVPLSAAIAASLVQRLSDKGLGTLYGTAAYLVARRRYQLQRRSMVHHRSTRRKAPTPT